MVGPDDDQPHGQESIPGSRYPAAEPVAEVYAEAAACTGVEARRRPFSRTNQRRAADIVERTASDLAEFPRQTSHRFVVS